MRVVDLADEFGLTTAETIDACLWAGVAADGAAAELTMEEVARVRELMDGWNEAGFAPWHGGATDANLAAAGTTTALRAANGGPGGPAGPGTGGPTGNGASTSAARATGAEPDDDDSSEVFSSRANRLKRREPGTDGLAAVARDNAVRRGPERSGAPSPGGSGPTTGPSTTGPTTTGPTPSTTPTGAAGGGPPAGGLPTRDAGRPSTAAIARADTPSASGAPSTPSAPNAPDRRPAPPTGPAAPAPTSTPPASAATIAATAAAAAGSAAAVAGATTAGGTATATVTADGPARVQAADASAAPDDDFGPSGPGTEVVGPSPVTTLAPVLPPPQGGPTGWLPGGPKAKPHLAPLAIIALALAIASLAIPFVPAVVAIVLAAVTKDRIDRSRGWLRGKPLATLAQVVAGIGVGLWLVLIVGSILLSNRTTTNQAPDLQVDRGLVSYTDVQTGDCVRLPQVGDVNQWHRVDCADPHQAEVFASFVVGNPTSQTYPGDLPIEATAKETCRQKLVDYAGTGGDTGRLEVGYAYPSAVTWKDQIDRTIHCVAFRSDGALLSGSLKVPSDIPEAQAGN